MFWSSRVKAEKYILESLKPFVDILPLFKCPPDVFWRDEFAIGFFGILISFYTSAIRDLSLSQEDKGRILFAVFAKLSNSDGLAPCRTYIRLAQLSKTPSESHDFELGADAATTFAWVRAGNTPSTRHPGFEKFKAARVMAADQGAPDDLSAVCGCLALLVFYEPLQAKFANSAL